MSNVRKKNDEDSLFATLIREPLLSLANFISLLKQMLFPVTYTWQDIGVHLGFIDILGKKYMLQIFYVLPLRFRKKLSYRGKFWKNISSNRESVDCAI